MSDRKPRSKLVMEWQLEPHQSGAGPRVQRRACAPPSGAVAPHICMVVTVVGIQIQSCQDSWIFLEKQDIWIFI